MTGLYNKLSKKKQARLRKKAKLQKKKSMVIRSTDSRGNKKVYQPKVRINDGNFVQNCPEKSQLV